MPLPFNATDLQNARLNLKGAFRDQALVDKFTAIRNGRLARCMRNNLGSLSDEDIEVLNSLCKRSSPYVDVAPHTEPSALGFTTAEMVFRTRFKARVVPAPPIRVIRFVRAAQINYLFGSMKDEHTVPGYVTYEKGIERPGRPSPRYVQNALNRELLRASWSYDGPAQEFLPGRFENEDTPGIKESALPYGITADFLIVLYDETARKILEVGRKMATMAVWKDKTVAFAMGPPGMLLLPPEPPPTATGASTAAATGPK